MMTRAKVLYFSGEIPQGDPEGDQQDLFRKLHLLSKERNHPILASFLESVTSAVKSECSQLSRDQKRVIPSFESVLDLTDHVVDLRKTPFGGAVERVLVLVFQLGSFIASVSPNTREFIKDLKAHKVQKIPRGEPLRVRLPTVQHVPHRAGPGPALGRGRRSLPKPVDDPRHCRGYHTGGIPVRTCRRPGLSLPRGGPGRDQRRRGLDILRVWRRRGGCRPGGGPFQRREGRSRALKSTV